MYAQLGLLFILGIPFVGAQNYTTCNPTTQSNCPPIPVFGSAETIYDFNQSYPITDIWDFDLFSQNTITQDSDGVHITVTAIGEEPYVETTHYLFYGKITAIMTSTNASTVGTYLNLQLDDTSEVDFQWNSNGSSVTAIYYEKGDTLNSTATVFFNSTFPVTSPHSNFHAYTFDWTEDTIYWIVDGETVATLGNTTLGSRYPQIPARVTIGLWCPACYRIDPGIVGTPIINNLETYVTTIRSLEVINYNPAIQYSYRDMSGLSSSIVIQQNEPSAKITGGGIAGIVLGSLIGILIIVGGFYWLRRRKVKRRIAGVYRHDLEIESPPTVSNKADAMGDIVESQRVRYPQELEPYGSIEVPAGNLNEQLGRTPSETRPGGRLGQSPGQLLGGRLGPRTIKALDNPAI